MNESYVELGTNVEAKGMYTDYDSVNNQLIVFSAELSSNYGTPKTKISATTPDPMSLETTIHYSAQFAVNHNATPVYFLVEEASVRRDFFAIIPGTAYYVHVSYQGFVSLFHNDGSSITHVSNTTFDRAAGAYDVLNHVVVDGEVHVIYV